MPRGCLTCTLAPTTLLMVRWMILFYGTSVSWIGNLLPQKTLTQILWFLEGGMLWYRRCPDKWVIRNGDLGHRTTVSSLTATYISEGNSDYCSSKSGLAVPDARVHHVDTVTPRFFLFHRQACLTTWWPWRWFLAERGRRDIRCIRRALALNTPRTQANTQGVSGTPPCAGQFRVDGRVYSTQRRTAELNNLETLPDIVVPPDQWDGSDGESSFVLPCKCK